MYFYEKGRFEIFTSKDVLKPDISGQPMELGGPVRQPYAEVNLIPPVRDYELGYSTLL
jgi:hypothetical protein